MKKRIFFELILFLSFYLYSIGQNYSGEKKQENILPKYDTIINIPIVSEDSINLYPPYYISNFYKVEQKDTDYRVEISKLMEESAQKIRGIYVPSWKIINYSKIDKLMEFMAKNHFNNLIFDLKNANGELFFSSENELAQQIKGQATTAEGRPRSIDLAHLKLKAKENNIKLTGRHVMFRDKVLYNHREDYRLREDQYWVDMRNQAVVDYNLSLLKEESTFGLDEIAIDYIRFPETNEFGSFDEKNRQIEEIVRRSSDIFKLTETEFGIFVFSYTVWGVDVGIGQNLTDLEGLVDRIYPMIYPSHFAQGTLGYAVPNDFPYEIIEKSCQRSNELMDDPEKSVPMLQAFWCSPNKLFLQIQAVHDNQMTGFVLWNAGGNYNLYFTY